VPGFWNRVERYRKTSFPPNSSAPLSSGQKLWASSSETERCLCIKCQRIRKGPDSHRRGLKDGNQKVFTNRQTAGRISNREDSYFLLMLKRQSNVIAINILITHSKSEFENVSKEYSERGRKKPPSCLSIVVRQTIFAQMWKVIEYKTKVLVVAALSQRIWWSGFGINAMERQIYQHLRKAKITNSLLLTHIP
jgi:hypothetical protein